MTSDLAALAVADLRKTYGRTEALIDVGFEAAAGSATAVLGPNGAGKTSLFEIVVGLRRADAGRVQVLGGTARAAVRAGRIGAMLQDGVLPAGATVGELLRMAASWYQDSAIPVDLVGGLDRKRTEALSGGEVQRVRLALALVGKPDLLVLDEPTSALDADARQAFWGHCRTLTASGAALLFATHRFEEAEAVADRILVLDHGRVAADATPGELKRLAGPGCMRFRLPAVASEGEQVVAALTAIDGVHSVSVEGDLVTLTTAAPDAVLRRVVLAHPEAADFALEGPDIEQAYRSALGRTR